MKTLSRQYGIIFLLGFVSLAAALASSMITAGELWAAAPVLSALRLFGLGLAAGAMALWANTRREEAGQTTLSPLFGFLTIGGALLLLVGLVFANSGLSEPAGLAGLGFELAAFSIALVAMIFFPAYPKPLAKQWPVGAEAVLTRFSRPDELHEHTAVAGHPAADISAETTAAGRGE